jgi:arylsulfatase
MKQTFFVTIVTFLSVFCFSASIAQAPEKPNILLIIADDLGYADLGVFGGNINTPNIDSLATQGTIFTQFHTAPLCAPTRAMLLTGNNNHVAGMALQGANPFMRINVPGYENHLSDRVAPMPRLLQEAGYHTYLTGKWHLGNTAEHSPLAAGFEKSFSLLHGAGSHFSSIGMREGGSVYWRNEEIADFPVGAYSTEIFTDELIGFIDSNRNDGQPFFAQAAYTSPHWPLQVPDEYLDLYSGQFDQGYDQLRIERLESLKQAGIIPSDSTLPPRNPAITPWEELSSDAQRLESRKMELYASMVENLDDHVGRLIDYLKTNDLYENTLIVFMSDNGAAAEDFYYTGPFVEYISSNYDDSYGNAGRPGSWLSYGPQWAEAGSAPFARHKGYATEGGIVAPMIISGRGLEMNETHNSEYITVMDLAPTFLEIAGAHYPDDGSVEPMLGESMIPLLTGAADHVHDDDYVTTLSHDGYAYVRKGDWKLVNFERPFSEANFQLFDLAIDPGETTNLAREESGKYTELLNLWREQRIELGIVVPEDL